VLCILQLLLAYGIGRRSGFLINFVFILVTEGKQESNRNRHSKRVRFSCMFYHEIVILSLDELVSYAFESRDIKYD